MGPEGCEFSEGTRNDFTHAVTSAGTLILMLGKLLNHIQSHYHHPTAEFDTIEVPLPLKVVSDSSKNPNPRLSQTSRIHIPIGHVRNQQLGFAFHGESINLIYPLKRNNPHDKLQGHLKDGHARVRPGVQSGVGHASSSGRGSHLPSDSKGSRIWTPLSVNPTTNRLTSNGWGFCLQSLGRLTGCH
ncbi:hypothetical protein AAG906_035764 [Vitis piasezkii]